MYHQVYSLPSPQDPCCCITEPFWEQGGTSTISPWGAWESAHLGPSLIPPPLVPVHNAWWPEDNLSWVCQCHSHQGPTCLVSSLSLKMISLNTKKEPLCTSTFPWGDWWLAHLAPPSPEQPHRSLHNKPQLKQLTSLYSRELSIHIKSFQGTREPQTAIIWGRKTGKGLTENRLDTLSIQRSFGNSQMTAWCFLRHLPKR